MLKLPRLPSDLQIVDPNGRPTVQFQTYWQQVIGQVENAVNGALDAIQAAGLAKQAAQQAQAAADQATVAADNASSAAGANAREQALVNSYIMPASVLSASPTQITVASHTRYYGDGTSVSVTGAVLDATQAGDVDYVSYSDPMRTGGAVDYVVSTTAPTQGMDIHVVGAVIIPATGSATGGKGPLRPGFVEP